MVEIVEESTPVVESNKMMSHYCEDRINANEDVDEDDPLKTEEACYKEGEEGEEQHLNIAPDGGWGWCVMIGCLITHVVIGGMSKSCGILYIKFMNYYDLSAETTSWIVSVNFTLMMLLGPLASSLCDRFSVRAVVATGALFSTVGTVLSAISPNVMCFFLTFDILTGIGFALVYSPSLIILSQYFHKKRSLVTGVATSGSPFSACLFPALLELEYSHYGLSGTLLLLAGGCSQLFVAAALYRPLEYHHRLMTDRRLSIRKHKTTEFREDQTRLSLPVIRKSGECSSNDRPSKCDPYTPVSAMTSTIRTLFHQLKHYFKGEIGRGGNNSKPSLLTNIAFTCFCIQLILSCVVIDTVYVYLPALVLDNGLDTVHGAYLISMLNLCDGLSRTLTSMLFDLKTLRKYRLLVYNAIIFSLAGCMVMFLLMTSFYQLGIVVGLYGISGGIYMAQKSVICVDIIGVDRLTESFGLMTISIGLGNLIALF